jgi:SAM-dependent methyltransferase
MLLDRLATSFGTVGFGIDVSRVTLERLRSESLHSHRIARSEGENLPFPEGSFDAAFSLDVLEHVETPERVLAEMLRVLRPGGVVVCYAISRKNRLTLNWFLMKALETLGVDHWAWNGHAPDRLVDPERTRAYLEHLGCRIQVYQPFHAFFTVLVDQWMLILYWMATRMRLLGERTHTRGMRPERLLDLVSNLVGGLLKPLSRLDRPWVSRGLSNGFLLAATKPLASSTLPPRP